MQPYYDAQPILLLGQNNWALIITRKLHELPEDGIGLSRSSLGWVAHGTLNTSSSRKKGVMNNINMRPEKSTIDEGEHLDELIKQYFTVESLGVEAAKEKRKRMSVLLRL